jgi:hypothetical protein
VPTENIDFRPDHEKVLATRITETARTLRDIIDDHYMAEDEE